MDGRMGGQGLIVDGRRDEAHTYRHAYTADIIELRVWPPMAGLHCAGGGLLAHSGGSGCATAWHRHLLQPKAGAIPLRLQGWTRGDGGGTAPYSVDSTSP